MIIKLGELIQDTRDNTLWLVTKVPQDTQPEPFRHYVLRSVNNATLSRMVHPSFFKTEYFYKLIQDKPLSVDLAKKESKNVFRMRRS